MAATALAVVRSLGPAPVRTVRKEKLTKAKQLAGCFAWLSGLGHAALYKGAEQWLQRATALAASHLRQLTHSTHYTVHSTAKTLPRTTAAESSCVLLLHVQLQLSIP
jgi:hypothetical protein